MVNNVLECRGYITKVYYPKSDFVAGEWASFQFEVDDVISGDLVNQKHGKDDHILVSGKMPHLIFGIPYYISASLRKHPKYGDQYELVRVEPIRELTNEMDQRRFLECILSESQVNKLYEHIDKPFDAVKASDFKLLRSVPGFGDHTVTKIVQRYQEAFIMGSAYAELAEFELTPTMLNNLISFYGSAETVLQKLKANPYSLIDEVTGIGWSKADKIARARGMPPNDPNRVQAYVSFLLNDSAKAGDTLVDTGTLGDQAMKLDEAISSNDVRDAIYALGDQGKIYWDDAHSYVGLVKLRELELSIARELKRLMAGSGSDINTTEDCTDALHRIEAEQGWQYVPEQLEAIRMARAAPVSIITGVAGSGKSSVVYGVLGSLSQCTVAQTALSGRAAARLGELTNSEGKTIHRLLGYFPRLGFTYNKNNPLDYDIIVLDEVSMVGAELFLSLLEAIPTGSKLIMLGDDGQLESIGLCNIFKDMLDSGTIPVCKLTKIHRQALKSAIKTEALKVRRAELICPPLWHGIETRGELQDLTLDVFEDRETTQTRVIETYKKWLQRGVAPSDLQVVVPMRQHGAISAQTISSIIQALVNPPSPLKTEAVIKSITAENDIESTLRVGDLVIATVNNYKTKTVDGDDCPVFNGNRGVITSIDHAAHEMIVDFDQWGKVVIPKGQWGQIDLAYALTCHKLQGSEAPYVIVALDYSAFALLTKEWLYTAITRASRHCTICAEGHALQYCIQHSNIPFKRTRLKEFLNTVKKVQTTAESFSD